MLDAGIKVGIGLDSPASSGPIDMFEEIRCALQVATERGRPLKPEEVWQMATDPSVLPLEQQKGATGLPDAPLIKIRIANAHSLLDVIERATPDHVEWV